jgi:hypothetical protein
VIVIATFGAASARAGEPITYENGVFTVGGRDPIGVAEIMDHDAAGRLTWASDALRVWVATLPRGPVKAARRPNRSIPIIIAAVICLVVLVAIAHAILARSSSGSSHGSGAWVKVYTWSGGGAADDIRDSSPFTLKGGHQRIHIVSVAVGSDPSLVSVGWTLARVGASGSSKTIIPTGVGVSDTELSLAGGYYYLSSDTVACTWVVTVSESR